MTPEETARRELVESLGHDFTDWRARPQDFCNFCHVKLHDPKAEQKCDTADQFKKQDAVIGKFYRRPKGA